MLSKAAGEVLTTSKPSPGKPGDGTRTSNCVVTKVRSAMNSISPVPNRLNVWAEVFAPVPGKEEARVSSQTTPRPPRPNLRFGCEAEIHSSAAKLRFIPSDIVRGTSLRRKDEYMGTILPDSGPGLDVPEKVLVRKVKAFLKRRLRKLAPDALLTHAWDGFYRTYSNVLRRMAAEFQLDAGEREDLVQEVWAQVVTHLSEFQWQELGSGLRGWLYTLIRNRALNLIRRKVRHPVWLADDLERFEVADRASGPAEQWEAHWDRELMHMLLAELEKKVSPLNHRLLILRWIEGRPLAEVALLLNLSERQVTYRQQRLFRKLRAARALYRGEPFGVSSEDPPPERVRSVAPGNPN